MTLIGIGKDRQTHANLGCGGMSGEGVERDRELPFSLQASRVAYYGYLRNIYEHETDC
jgi:hypothetical protein